MKAAIFDMDGLLIDSEPLWRRAEREVFSSVGLALSDDDCRRTTGLRADEVVRFWFDRDPWQGPGCDEVHERLLGRVTDLIRTNGSAMAGVHHALACVRGAGLQLALASSSPVALIEVVLETLGLDGVFEVCSSGADEEHGKPDPAVYLTTVSKLGVAAKDCIAFEDSVAGVQAAKSAGIFTIAVPDPVDFDDPDFDIADLKLHSLKDFDLDSIGG